MDQTNQSNKQSSLCRTGGLSKKVCFQLSFELLRRLHMETQAVPKFRSRCRKDTFSSGHKPGLYRQRRWSADLRALGGEL